MHNSTAHDESLGNNPYRAISEPKTSWVMAEAVTELHLPVQQRHLHLQFALVFHFLGMASLPRLGC